MLSSAHPSGASAGSSASAPAPAPTTSCCARPRIRRAAAPPPSPQAAMPPGFFPPHAVGYGQQWARSDVHDCRDGETDRIIIDSSHRCAFKIFARLGYFMYCLFVILNYSLSTIIRSRGLRIWSQNESQTLAETPAGLGSTKYLERRSIGVIGAIFSNVLVY